MKRILVTRFSAMGDVAMVASVLREFQEQHTEVEIIMVSRAFFAPFFQGIPRVSFHPIYPEKQHQGLVGLYKLFKELRAYRPTELADLHDNIRSNILSTFFRMSGYKVRTIDKGRKEKKALTRPINKIKKQLKLTTERYADVFRSLGYAFQLSNQLQRSPASLPKDIQTLFAGEKKDLGIAPFAQHPYKVFALDRMEQVIAGLAADNIQILVFGGGSKEKEIVDTWAKKHPHVFNTIGKFSLREELDIIANLDLMLSMDSSGMHMASLVGIRSLSIWGATHPFAGFIGYGQSIEDCVQVEHPNRPSSVYGNKPCICDGTEAIDLLTAEMVISKVKNILLKTTF